MIGRDIRVSIRLLLRSPAFALTGVFTLAVAIGLSVSVFSVVNATLIRPLPYPDADRLAMIWTLSHSGSRDPVSFDAYVVATESADLFMGSMIDHCR